MTRVLSALFYKNKGITATIIYIPTDFFDLNLCIKIKIKLVSLIRIENAKNCQSHSACMKINSFTMSCCCPDPYTGIVAENCQ